MIMPAIEGYIGKCHPENFTVDRGVSLGDQWSTVEFSGLHFPMYPSIAGFFYYMNNILNVVK
jgi:hypothetical protein